MVLGEVRRFWGPQNSLSDVFFTENNDAALFVKARNGGLPVLVVLTNLGEWVANGTLSSRELRRQIMGPMASGRSPLGIVAISLFARIRAFILGWN
jgi:hypothetical protein